MPSGRIHQEVLDQEIQRLRAAWGPSPSATDPEAVLTAVLGPNALANLDLFDRAQLAVVLGICRESATLSEAGRKLFAVSRGKRQTANDADRLRKYLARFGLDWKACRE